MTRRRVMGTEVEYGISVVGQPHANPMAASTQVVNAYAATAFRARRPRWDYEEETPLRDARGGEMARGVAHPSQLTDEDPGMANVVLTNGARLYVDHAHPEYSGPEVTGPRDAVLWDKAGERVMQRAVELLANDPDMPSIQLYKNNTDNKGASYGAHENYLMDRSTPFNQIVRHMIPFLVSRQVVCGAGRVGVGQDGRGHAFQVSQRADFFEVDVGLETTLKRPIVNTRDEPHADPRRHRRLHVIIGDANLAEVSTFLKMGTTALVLDMLEDGFLPDDLGVVRPVAALRAISHDPSLTHLVELQDGRRVTGVDLQRIHHEHALRYVEQTFAGDVDPQTSAVLQRWGSVLDRLARDPFECARELDWVAKWQLLERYRDRDGLDWSDAKLQLIDLQYADVRPEKGLYNRLVASGRMERLLDEEEVQRAVLEPPTDTRAWFRGECVRRFGEEVSAASWDSVILNLPGHDALQRVPTSDPFRGTKDHVGDLLDRCEDATDLFRALTHP